MTFHPDNPRVIDPGSLRQLRENVKRGYVGGIVWNRRTGHIVGGNQRVTVLDELHKGKDYALEIDVIDVDERREKELLVSLNNLGLQGDWDVEKLGRLLPDIDLAASGFDRLDLESLFPDRDFSSLFSDANETPEVKADAATIEAMKESKKAAYKKGRGQEDAGFVLHLVFGDSGEKSRYLERTGLSTEDGYLDGRRHALAVGIDLGQGE